MLHPLVIKYYFNCLKNIQSINFIFSKNNINLQLLINPFSHFPNACFGPPESPNKNTFKLVLSNLAVLFFDSLYNETVDFSFGNDGTLSSFCIDTLSSAFIVGLAERWVLVMLVLERSGCNGVRGVWDSNNVHMRPCLLTKFILSLNLSWNSLVMDSTVDWDLFLNIWFKIW